MKTQIGVIDMKQEICSILTAMNSCEDETLYRMAEVELQRIETKARFADEIIEFCKAGDFNFDMIEAIEMMYTEIFCNKSE